MDDKTLKTLEFNKIAAMLSDRCVSAAAKEMAESLKPVSDYDKIIYMQRETTEAAGMVYRKGAPPLGGVRDIRAQLKRVEMGGMLNV